MATRSDKSAEEFRRMKNLLSKLPDRNPREMMDDAETYICPTCQLPVKLCDLQSGACCHLMIKGNTELSLIEQRIWEVSHGIERSCIRCGRSMTTRQLKTDPTRELCPDCRKRAVRKRRR